MRTSFLKGTLEPPALLKSLSYKRSFKKEHPDYFDPDGLLVFSGPQGSGKTLSAVQYCRKVLERYPHCKFVTNVAIDGLSPDIEVIPYDGLTSLSDINNGFYGVLYLIDELHLEFNSLESKSISIEEMTEFAQQRKQRKHIVGTSQVFMRLAKPLREQVKRVVLCRNFFGLIQHNQEIDGTTAHEEGGHLVARVTGNYWWFHTPDLYGCYDTFAKMHRYKKEWQGRKLAPQPLPYEPSAVTVKQPGERSKQHLRGDKRTGFHIVY